MSQTEFIELEGYRQYYRYPNSINQFRTSNAHALGMLITESGIS